MNLKELSKEIPFKWRVQSANKWGAKCVAYIDARDVQDRLDEVCGLDWQCKYSEHKGNLFCSIGIHALNNKTNTTEWVWRSDCGTESNVEKEKGEASDAFKRAAVMWGIGRFLYSKELVKLTVLQKDGKWTPYSESKKKYIYGDDITEWCNQLSKL